jgi:hypothetical protein
LGDGWDGVVRLPSLRVGLGLLVPGAAKEPVAKKVVMRTRVVGCIVADG